MNQRGENLVLCMLGVVQLHEQTIYNIFSCKYAHVITYEYSRMKLCRNLKQLLRK